MSELVIDASVLVKAVVPESDSDRVDEVIRMCERKLLSIGAPELVLAESGNVLWKYFRRGLLTKDEVAEAMTRLLALPLTLVGHERLVTAAVDLATSHERSVYDCLYLALAQVNSLPFVTADERLFNALSQEGYRMHLLRDWEPESLLHEGAQ